MLKVKKLNYYAEKMYTYLCSYIEFEGNILFVRFYLFILSYF
jgi:hypothetical protein